MVQLDCPSCGGTFGDFRDLEKHHRSEHGGTVPNTECSHCGEQYYDPHKRKYCSDSCKDEAVSFVGSDNPNYSGGKTTTRCEICGAKFEYYPSEKKGLYCSECVETKEWRDVPTVEGEDHPRWVGGKRELECDICGTTVERYPSNITGEATLCSDECQYEWLSESFTGEGHPNWEGGDTGNYGKGWNRVRRQALERDGYECQHCGKTRAEIGRNPDVHHIVPVRVFAESEATDKADAHHLGNVVSLCVDCHRKADFGTISKERLRGLIGG